MASGEVAWFGAGRSGKDDGRVVLVRREMLDVFAPPTPEEREGTHAKLLDALRERGAQFFTDLVVAAAAPYQEVLEALWDLVWDGAVTNDTLAPVRALSWHRRPNTALPGGRVGRLPPESAGRWSLVRRTAPEESRAALTARSHARAGAFLERLGIVTREGVAADDLAGGFSAVYPVLKAMEDAGRVRRGYFVEALGAAQFALPGAAERLRAEREAPEEPIAVVVSAVDPAQPYGATLPWPRDDAESRKAYQRVPGARVVLVDGVPVLYLDRSHRGLLTFPGNEDSALFEAARALSGDGVSLGAKGLSIERIDGAPADESQLAAVLLDLGFARGFRGLTKRPERAEAAAHA
jgi:ATP-dependent Lhr-like helicase